MTTTVYFTIGNSDDRLTQSRWSSFVTGMHMVVHQAVQAGAVIEFAGYSPPAARWQNALWCVRLPDLPTLDRLRHAVLHLAGQFDQDTVAWCEVGAVQLLPTSRCCADVSA